LRLLELNHNSFTDITKNTDSYVEKENDDYQSRMTEVLLVEQGKASWSDDAVEQGYCLVVSLLEGCEPALLPELLDGLGDEIVSCLLYVVSKNYLYELSALFTYGLTLYFFSCLT